MSPAPGALFLPVPSAAHEPGHKLWPHSTHSAIKVSRLGSLEARELLGCQVGIQELKQVGFQAEEPMAKAVLCAAPTPTLKPDPSKLGYLARVLLCTLAPSPSLNNVA